MTGTIFINMADIVDPNDEAGRTYRQINAAKAHSIPIGALVETANGARLFVARHDRDCDQTPLYALSPEIYALSPAPSHIEFGAVSAGWSEDSIRVVRRRAPRTK